MRCYTLLQGIFPTQGLNPCLLCWQTDSLPLSYWEVFVNRVPITEPPGNSLVLLLNDTSIQFSNNISTPFCIGDGFYWHLYLQKLSLPQMAVLTITSLPFSRPAGQEWIQTGQSEFPNPLAAGTNLIQNGPLGVVSGTSKNH